MGQPSEDYSPKWLERRDDLQMIQQSVESFDIDEKFTEKEFEELFAQAIDAQKKKDKEATSESAKKSKSARTVKGIE